jgi:hypothetical protein
LAFSPTLTRRFDQQPSRATELVEVEQHARCGRTGLSLCTCRTDFPVLAWTATATAIHVLAGRTSLSRSRYAFYHRWRLRGFEKCDDNIAVHSCVLRRDYKFSTVRKVFALLYDQYVTRLY